MAFKKLYIIEEEERLVLLVDDCSNKGRASLLPLHTKSHCSSLSLLGCERQSIAELKRRENKYPQTWREGPTECLNINLPVWAVIGFNLSPVWSERWGEVTMDAFACIWCCVKLTALFLSSFSAPTYKGSNIQPTTDRKLDAGRQPNLKGCVDSILQQRAAPHKNSSGKTEVQHPLSITTNFL